MATLMLTLFAVVLGFTMLHAMVSLCVCGEEVCRCTEKLVMPWWTHKLAYCLIMHYTVLLGMVLGDPRLKIILAGVGATYAGVVLANQLAHRTNVITSEHTIRM